jgi:hypothetical protein
VISAQRLLLDVILLAAALVLFTRGLADGEEEDD